MAPVHPREAASIKAVTPLFFGGFLRGTLTYRSFESQHKGHLGCRYIRGKNTNYIHYSSLWYLDEGISLSFMCVCANNVYAISICFSGSYEVD